MSTKVKTAAASGVGRGGTLVLPEPEGIGAAALHGFDFCDELPVGEPQGKRPDAVGGARRALSLARV